MNVGLAPVSSLPTGNASQSSVARGRLTRRTRVVDEARRRPIGSPCATIIPRRVLAPIPRRGVRSALRDSRVDRKPRCSDPPPPPPPAPRRAMRSVRFLSSQFPVFRPRVFSRFRRFCVSFTRVPHDSREIAGRGSRIGKSAPVRGGRRFEAESVGTSTFDRLAVDLRFPLKRGSPSQAKMIIRIRRQFDASSRCRASKIIFACSQQLLFYTNVN